MDLHELPQQQPAQQAENQQDELDEWGLRCISDEELRAETERTASTVTEMRKNVAKQQQAALALQSSPELLETYHAMAAEYRRTLERTEAKLRACEAEKKRRREQAELAAV